MTKKSSTGSLYLVSSPKIQKAGQAQVQGQGQQAQVQALVRRARSLSKSAIVNSPIAATGSSGAAVATTTTGKRTEESGGVDLSSSLAGVPSPGSIGSGSVSGSVSGLGSLGSGVGSGGSVAADSPRSVGENSVGEGSVGEDGEDHKDAAERENGEGEGNEGDFSEFESERGSVRSFSGSEEGGVATGTGAGGVVRGRRGREEKGGSAFSNGATKTGSGHVQLMGGMIGVGVGVGMGVGGVGVKKGGASVSRMSRRRSVLGAVKEEGAGMEG